MKQIIFLFALGISISLQAQTISGLPKYITSDGDSLTVTDAVDASSRVRISNTLNPYSGWGSYTDGIHDTGNPISLTDGVKVTLPNDADTRIEHQLPLDIDSLYSRTDSTILGKYGDGLVLTIEFKVRPTSVANTRLTVSIDIGGAVGEIYPRDFVLSKGNGVEHYFLSSFGAYTLDTWEANGGKVKALATGGPAEIYDVRYVINRIHKGRL